jgi:hypothetical protein
VDEWIKQNPSTPQPQSSDLAVLLFENFSKDNPGKLPSAVTKQLAGGPANVRLVAPTLAATNAFNSRSCFDSQYHNSF